MKNNIKTIKQITPYHYKLIILCTQYQCLCHQLSDHIRFIFDLLSVEFSIINEKLSMHTVISS